MAEDLQKKVLKDLEKSGFGSEMRVLKALVDQRWRMVGSDVYLDGDENRLRENDASGFIKKWGRDPEGDTELGVYVFLSIEVKKSDGPWVVFKPPRVGPLDHEETLQPLVYATGLPCDMLRLAPAISKNSVVEEKGWFARGLHEAFKDPKKASRWYSATVSACKAAEYVMHREASAEAPRGSKWDPAKRDTTYFLLSRPVVVLDGPLMSAEVDGQADIVLEEIEACAFEFHFKSKHCQEGRYYVDLVTLAGLDSYLESWVARRDNIAEAIRIARGCGDLEYKD